VADPVGLYLQDDLPMNAAIKHVQYAEARGYHAIWQAETRLVRDSLAPLAAFAAVTSRIRLGTGVANIWSRNPATLAATYLTLDDIAPDRIMAGLGIWHEPLAAKVGIRRNKPLLAMREVATSLRRLLHRERVTLQGEFVQLTDVSLDITHGRSGPRQVPIYIAATGPKLMALSGEIADGVLLNYLTAPSYTAGAITQLEIGAKQANRTLDMIDRPQLIVCSVSNDRAKAIDRARRLVTQYIRGQPAIMRANGIRHDLIDEVEQVLPWPASREQIAQAARLVPDDVVQTVTASGTPEDCKAKIRQYMAAGATYPVLYPLQDDYTAFIDTFAHGYD
jgi:5,10-methylenetetrahydromethanopterin reductase